MNLNIDVDRSPKAVVVKLGGRLNGETSEVLLERCRALIAEKPVTMVLDLTNVLYISSAGLSSVLLTGKELSATNGRLILCGLKGSVKDAFSFTGFDAIFPIFEHLEKALAHAG